jgi:hypothetical protein
MKSNYEHLVELIKDNEEAVEFADAMKQEYEEDLDEAKDDLKDAETKNDELQSMIYSMEETSDLGKDIDCGVGTISYEVNGSLDLVYLMEALAERIKKDGYKPVLRLLEYDLTPA